MGRSDLRKYKVWRDRTGHETLRYSWQHDTAILALAVPQYHP